MGLRNYMGFFIRNSFSKKVFVGFCRKGRVNGSNQSETGNRKQLLDPCLASIHIADGTDIL